MPWDMTPSKQASGSKREEDQESNSFYQYIKENANIAPSPEG